MFKIKYKILEVKSVSINNKRIIILKKNGEVFINNEIVFKGGKYTFANNIGEQFYNYGDKSEQYLFNDKKLLLVNSYDSNTLFEEGVVIYKNQKITDAVECDYYFKSFLDDSERLLLKSAIGGFVFNYDENTKSIFRSINDLSLISFLTGKSLWQTSLSSYGTISKILGVADDKLWIWLSDYQLIALAIDTGEVVVNTKPLEPLFKAGHYFFDFPYLDVQVTTLYFFERQYFIAVNLKTLQTQVLWQATEPINIFSPSFSTNFICFIAALQNEAITPLQIGVFNRTNLQIEWLHQESFKDRYTFFNQAPQYVNNKLYALDNGGTLHIYEREVREK